ALIVISVLSSAPPIVLHIDRTDFSTQNCTEIPDMGKKKRAATAAWRAAAATSQPTYTTMSPATQLVATVAPADPPVTIAANEPAPALTQQPNDSHARTACPAHPAPSIALHTTSGSPNAISAPRNASAASFATEREPDGNLAPATVKPREPRSVQTHLAPVTALRTSNVHTVTTGDAREPARSNIRPTAAALEPLDSADEPRSTRGANERPPPDLGAPANHDALPALSEPHHTSHAVPAVGEHHITSTPSPNASHTQFPALLAGPAATFAALATSIEQRGPPDSFLASPAPVFALHDPHDTVPHDPQHTRTRTRPATSIEEVDEGLVAQIQKTAEDEGWAEGCDAGTVVGRASGYREGYEAAKREVSNTISGPDGVPVVDTTPSPMASLTSRTDPAYAVPRAGPTTPLLASGVEPEQLLAPHADEPGKVLSANANTTPASSISDVDTIDGRLLQQIRREAYSRGYANGGDDAREDFQAALDQKRLDGYVAGREEEYRTWVDKKVADRSQLDLLKFWEGFKAAQQVAGASSILTCERADAHTQTDAPIAPPPHRMLSQFHPDLSHERKAGRTEGRDAGYLDGLEIGRKMGLMEGRERGFADGKFAGVQAGRVLERVEVRRIARPSVHVQTDDRPVRTYVDIAIRTSPTACIDAAMQTLPLYAAAMPFIEDPDPTLLDPTHLKEIMVTALYDGHAAGLKEGRHVGLQEGIKVGRECTRAEACRIMRTSCQVQTDDPPTLVHVHTAVAPAPFSWADDADSLPIRPPPPLSLWIHTATSPAFSAAWHSSITVPSIQVTTVFSTVLALINPACTPCSSSAALCF
ncbi:hypothetical protein EWM64_g10487, partial [Hericium alpestre]